MNKFCGGTESSRPKSGGKVGKPSHHLQKQATPSHTCKQMKTSKTEIVTWQSKSNQGKNSQKRAKPIAICPKHLGRFVEIKKDS